jgi:hypothetical protein
MSGVWSQESGDLPGVCKWKPNSMSISQEQSVAQAHNPSRKRNELPGHQSYRRAETILHRARQHEPVYLYPSLAYLSPSHAR